MTTKITNEVVVYQKSLAPIAEQAQTLEIVSADTLKTGVEILSQLNNFNDKIVEEREKVTKPLNEALKAERGRWKPLQTMYETAIESLRTKMSQYQTNLVKAQKEAEAKIAARVGEGKGHLKIETAVAKLADIKTPEKEVSTDKGLVQFVNTPTLKITDATKIPDEYYELNESKLLIDLKAGKSIAGCEIKIIQTVRNYR